MTPKTKPYAEYIGRGEYQVGIPARDLTKADWDAMDEAARKQAEASGLYRFNDAPDAGHAESTLDKEG